ncbi:MAG: hypothetical protein ACREU0_07295 [Burkholderiales bacterium]
MTVSIVPNEATQGAEAYGIPGVESLSLPGTQAVLALVNGVAGGKWYSLMDKIYAPTTLALAWARVQANQGAAGVEGLLKATVCDWEDKVWNGLQHRLTSIWPNWVGTCKLDAINRKRSNGWKSPKGTGRPDRGRYPDGQGPDCADGGQVGDRTDL